MPNVWAITTCTNNAGRTRRSISFHTFPRKGDIREQWIAACKRADDFNPDTSRICSEHFVAEDYIRDLKAELLGYTPKKKILKDDAVPHRNLPELLQSQIIPVTGTEVGSPRQLSD